MLAQIPNLAIDQLGFLVLACFVVLMGLGSIFGVAVSIKTLFFPRPDGMSALVTHGDLDSAVKQMMLKIESLATRESVTVMNARLGTIEGSHRELHDYTHDSIHRLSGTLQTILNKITRIETIITQPGTMTLPGAGPSDDALPIKTPKE